MRQSTRVVVFLLALAASAAALVNAYHVDPVNAAQSGWTGSQFPNNNVSEIVTCSWDSLEYVELFAGDSGSTGSNYRVGVLDDGAEIAYATGVQRMPASWVRFDNWNTQPVFIKGRKYEFRFTRSGQDSVQYYYSEVSGGGSYGYGILKVGNDTFHDLDLAIRVGHAA